MEYKMSGVGSSVLSRCATAKTSRSPLRADSMARSVPGRPAAMGAVNPGKMTVPRSGRTGSVWRVAIDVFLEEVICGEPPAVAPSIPDGPESHLSHAAPWLTCAHSAVAVKVAQRGLAKIGQSGSVRCHNHD